MTEFSELHDASSKPWTQLSSFTALVFLLLTQNCSGLSQVVGPSQPVLAMVGDDVLLSCRLEPAVDASDMSIEWSREDLDPSYVYVWWDKEELESSKHPDYKGRTSLLFNKLEFGDVSLKLSKVKLSDEGKYRCFIPTLGRGSTVELVVGTDPFTVITLEGLGRTSSSVVLQCESAGWYPKPEVLWLDGDGNLLSAGPTETVRGPDDLYTVSSRVTVEQKHSNKFTCRVQQNNINQSREALIQVTGKRKTLVNEKQEELERYKDEKKTFLETKRSLLDEKLKSMKTERKLKTVIQNMIHELDEMNFDTNSDPTGSDEKNQQEELEKLQDEKQKWMKTVVNLKTELQDMNQELKLAGPIIMEEVNERDRYISLKNISTEEMELKGWKLTLHRNGELLVRFTFNESFKRQAGEILCIAHPSWFSKHPDDVDLVWSELKYWIPGDKMKMNLISNNGELFRLL
ncbi:butyrophilin subfamily 3 member A3-like [Acanthochromis polyacanthus]|uniref:butyrophilin subfamily 3 member A3-like n=1 Tax=Acanthochromis polyacanthus TaxID=80966 RepID=UPI002234B719|nr:butyrophilin subfamily 3 member A3-like [Acanthochromis polyacanthus]